MWTRTADGTIALEGSIMSIVYSQHSNGDFSVMQGDRFRLRTYTLGAAKQEAERIAAELSEIGVC